MTRPRLRLGLRLRLARYGLDFRKGLHPTPSPPKSQAPLPPLILLRDPKYLGSYSITLLFAILLLISSGINFYLWRRRITNSDTEVPADQPAHNDTHSRGDENQSKQPDPDSQQCQPPEIATPIESQVQQEESSGKVTIYVNDFARFANLYGNIATELDFLQRTGHKSESLEAVQEQLVEALSDCGIKQFSPLEGESYRTAFGVAPQPTFVPTTNRSDAWKIVKTRRSGLYVESEPRICLKEAIVVVYKYTEGD